MKMILDILRRENAQSEPWHQSILFETEDENCTVAGALTAINDHKETIDTEGRLVGKIVWQSSCLQKKCGACAMLIGGRPRLACDTQLREFARKGRVTLEPLKKFPVVADLMVDREIMYANLDTIRVWLEDKAGLDEDSSDQAYDASRCLQCGCCLEVCPNFYPGGFFTGPASVAPASRLISMLPDQQKAEFFKSYEKHIFEGCGKSLACENICPAQIEVNRMLIHSNAAAVWKRKPLRRKKHE